MSEALDQLALQSEPPPSESRSDDPLWYKDAIIYEVHVKSYFDSNGDGIGDFKGLLEKLDYIQDLGVNTIWLLPFYPSPLKDDGYDIADYHNVNPDYGTRKDFAHFVREAHRRGLRVITELVINHTSDQHPWFQAARRAPPESSKRDYYVWSDTPDKFAGTRIIFTDTETSNWAWDKTANAYYWHRFFSHQPDLNFDNPKVLKAVLHVMRFWLDMGVDGLRLDAIPYLCVREGTNGENLPETHDILKQIRAVVDDRYRNRMLLAEANQWPEDVRDYFGNGDECHMAYHFPLMPRIYMAIAQEDRHPIIEIMQQTPDIPPTCQWAIFLRNHDELTLEMVTSKERDYMYQMYAADPRARLNLGIRRRLAPLMDNDPDKIKLMNSLLLSMPGTPIIYYGDEIGMGDNVYLGDRDGVRTPMQWNPDRNAGFSSADPQRLNLPLIMDPIYGYHAVNVEAQLRSPSSLLNWMRRVLAVRKAHQAFGRGTLEFLRADNRKVLAYLREYADESFLCVANLARAAQPARIELPRHRGFVPIEVMGHAAFPAIGDAPYQLTLPGHSFYWFQLVKREAAALREELPPREELPVLVLFDGWNSFFSARVVPWRIGLAERMRSQFEREVMPRFVAEQRWFATKGEPLRPIELIDCAEWKDGSPVEGSKWLLALFRRGAEAAEPQQYFVPLALMWESREDEAKLRGLLHLTITKVRQQAEVGTMADAFADEDFSRSLVAAIGSRAEQRFMQGTLRFRPERGFTPPAADELKQLAVQPPGAQSSNTTVDLGGKLFLKAYRRPQAGVNPEVELGRFLTESAHFANIVPLLGSAEYTPDGGEPMTLLLLQAYVENQGDAWRYTLDYLERFFEGRLVGEPMPSNVHGGYLALVRTLGRRTAEFHLALASGTDDPALKPEPIESADMTGWAAQMRAEAEATLERLARKLDSLPDAARSAAATLLERRDTLPAMFERCKELLNPGFKTRHHGDYHLGQVLMSRNDFIIIDLEGEPARSQAERRRKHSPLRDVAGMLRSFNYAMHTALLHGAVERPDSLAMLEPHGRDWERETAAAFLGAYADATQGSGLYSDWDNAQRLLEMFVLEKAFYELRYELDARPEWVRIPLLGIADIAGRAMNGEAR